ncbi:MAG: GtrA family protein [Acidimicrobiales bacterium]
MDISSSMRQPSPALHARASARTRLLDRARAFFAHPLVRHPLVRRITGYSAGSVVAIVISEACFAGAYGWAHSGTTIASAVGFVGGAVPNYVLNRRWAWQDRRGRDRRSELVMYMTVALATFVVSAVVTHFAEGAARHLTTDRSLQVALVTAAFLAVSAVFFVVKFVIYETLVFTKNAEVQPALAIAPNLRVSLDEEPAESLAV